jgi:hypothetical protein
VTKASRTLAIVGLLLLGTGALGCGEQDDAPPPAVEPRPDLARPLQRHLASIDRACLQVFEGTRSDAPAARLRTATTEILALVDGVPLQTRVGRRPLREIIAEATDLLADCAPLQAERLLPLVADDAPRE